MQARVPVSSSLLHQLRQLNADLERAVKRANELAAQYRRLERDYRESRILRMSPKQALRSRTIQ
jgi:hypothetical protein